MTADPRFWLLSLAVILAAGCSHQPPRTIYHLTNWHYVSRDDFAADLRSHSDETIPDAEIDQRYTAFAIKATFLQDFPSKILKIFLSVSRQARKIVGFP